MLFFKCVSGCIYQSCKFSGCGSNAYVNLASYPWYLAAWEMSRSLQTRDEGLVIADWGGAYFF